MYTFFSIASLVVEKLCNVIILFNPSNEIKIIIIKPHLKKMWDFIDLFLQHKYEETNNNSY